MEDINKEVILEKYPKPISIKGTKEIINQMENCICKIYKNGGGKGTGFFCKILYNNFSIPVMMTNNHVIDEKYIKENNNIELTLNDDNINKTIILDKNRKIYTNKEYDITIIEIICDKDNINNFMDLDEKIFNDKSEILYNNQSIYIPQYLKGDKAVVSYGIINTIDGFDINHYCCTESGSSGSPIINLLNNKIIGIHKQGSNHLKYNKGTYLKYPINEFIDNEIEITLDINKSDINKKIYFLDNTDYIDDKTRIKFFHDNLKELNENNTELYINNIKCKFQKYFIPEKEGNYKIKLIFKIDNKDCSFMFAGCKNIIDINLKYFNTSNVINMRYMFSGCENIKELDLSSFNTKNVKNMEGMFGGYNNLASLDWSSVNIKKQHLIKIYINNCKSLEKLNLSSFDTQKINNMLAMFFGCSQLKELNLSSFKTNNVNNMMMMFSGCTHLKEINLSSFNTKNVINMMMMFSGCAQLKELNLSLFDTKNVNNMMAMFAGCAQLKKLNLSSFDTKNVNNMMMMFFDCVQLKELNLSSFNTKNVNNMMMMFFRCSELKELNLSSFDTINVDNMMMMFSECKELTELNISSFNIKNVNKVKGIFYLCDINKFNLSSFSKFKIGEMISEASIFDI